MAGRAKARSRAPKRAERSAPVTNATGEHIEALFATLEQAPDDHATALVLADALQEQNDVRAELILVQHAIATAPKDQRDQLRAREAALVHATRTRLLGAELAPQPGITLDVRDGFVRRLGLSNLSLDQLGRALTSALRSPDGRLLDTLELGSDDEEVIGVGELFHDLAGEVKPPASLRRVKIGSAFDASDDDRVGRLDGDDEYDDRPVEDLRGVLAMFPRLRELELDLGTVGVQLGVLASKRLERLTWISPRITGEDLEPLTASVLPALVRFELWPGATYDYAGRVDEDDDEEYEAVVLSGGLGARAMRSVFAMLDRSPVLRELAIGNYGNSIPKLLEALRQHELVRRLHTFELVHLELDGDAADELVDFVRATPTLQRLAVDRVHAGEHVRLSLERRLGPKLDASWASKPPRFRYVAGREY